MNLRYWMGHMYRTSVVSRGEGHEEIKRMFRAALKDDQALRAEAEAERAKLAPVDKSRQGRDFVTRKQMEFLDAVLKKEDA